jgi:hypothetical protein
MQKQDQAASEIFGKSSGRTQNLARIVASNGASVALTLLHQAEVLARRK